MKLRLLIALLFCCLLTALSADVAESLIEADRLNDLEDYASSETFLNGVLKDAGTPKEKAEVLWRISRTTLYLGNQASDRNEPKDRILKIYEKGESLADQALALDGTQVEALYWKASNIGKWGTTKGILDALGKAKPMRESLTKLLSSKADHADSYYVLGMLYEKVPGFPLSFGNADSAVSFGRISVALYEKEMAAGTRSKPLFDFYIQLASHLIERDWDSAKRLKELDKKASKYRSLKDPVEKGSVYEGSVTLQKISDKEEAAQLLKKAISGLESLSVKTPSQQKDLDTAKEMLKKLS